MAMFCRKQRILYLQQYPNLGLSFHSMDYFYVGISFVFWLRFTDDI